MGIMDLRSMGYFKVRYKDLVSHLSSKFTMYHYLKSPPNPDTEDVYLRTSLRNPPHQAARTLTPGLRVMTPGDK